jgi:hypothetical protein
MSKNEKPNASIGVAVVIPIIVDVNHVIPKLRVTQNNLSFLESIYERNSSAKFRYNSSG